MTPVDKLLRKIVEIEIKKLKHEKAIASLTMSQGLLLRKCLSDFDMPVEGDEVEIDLGTAILSGKYHVQGYGFNVKSEPEKSDGKFTGDFDVSIILRATGLKMKTRKSFGDKVRTVAEKIFKMRIERASVFLDDEDPDEILTFLKDHS